MELEDEDILPPPP